MSERDISPEALEAAFRRLRQEVSLRVQAPPVATLIKKSRARSRRRLLVAATASAAAVLATVFLLLPDDASTPAPVGPVSVELSAPLVNGEPAAVAPGPVMTAGASAQVDVTAANTGERTLTDVAASADGSDLTCLVTTLDPGEATTCSTSVVPLEGPQQLAVDVTADDPDAETVTDRITVFMRGTPPPRPAVAISDPMMDGESAGAAQRPSVPTDQDVRVEVVVTNSGERPLEDLTARTIEDGRELSCDATRIPVGGDVTCSVGVRPDVGPGEIAVRVTAVDPDGNVVRDTITVHYSGAPPPPPPEAFLTADDANVVLGSWTGGTFSPTSATPSGLRFSGGCTPDPLPDATDAVLSDGQNAAVSTTIGILPTDGDAQQTLTDLVAQVSTCIEARPTRDQMFNGLPAGNATGTAQAYGALVGTGRGAGQYEYIIVARDGAAVEVCTFATYAQDTLPETTLEDLADRVLDRLAAAS
ncbi:MAG: hypothetical protein ACRDPQ_07400 [Nocardioidaceae bacterium]